MREYGTDAIRNVAIIGHGGTGKTSLAEALLFKSGALARLGRVDDGTSAGDFDADEHKRTMTINLALLPFEWHDTKVNLIDTPGYPDFAGELYCGLHAADAALVVVDASAGVQVGTTQMWSIADERDLPRVVFVNRMDRENADFGATLAALRRAFGSRCAPLQMPIGSHESFQGVIDLVRMRAFVGPDGDEMPVPDPLMAEAAAFRDQLIEAVAENDEALLTKYLEGDDIGEAELMAALTVSARAGAVVPVLAGSAARLMGIEPLATALASLLPSPAQARPVEAGGATIAADPDAAAVAHVFKTTADPYVGKLTYFRVVAGTVASDSHLMNANKDKDERLAQLFVVRGKAHEPVARLVAGDIGAVAKLSDTTTGDALCARERLVKLPAVALPKPVYEVAIVPKTKADLDKLGTALARIVEEDPTLSVRRDNDTHETILAGMGEAHVEVAAERMHRKFGVEVEIHTPKVAYKETVRTKARSEYKHKKQTGGHGQYGHVFLEIEPLPRGAGFEFVERVVGGSVPKNFIPAVEKGVNETLAEGAVSNCPLVDLRVTLYDGSSHPVDSSEMAFKIAAAQALKKGVHDAGAVLLEPVMKMSVRVPDDHVGDVISDLNTKRAHVLGMTPDGGSTIIEATAPRAEVQRYATDLRSLTQARGSFSMAFDHYAELPAHLTGKVVGAAAVAV